MLLLLKFIIFSALLIASSLATSEEKNLEENPLSSTDNDLKGNAVAFDDDDPEIDVDGYIKRYENETVAVLGDGGLTGDWYRSKQFWSPDFDEVISASEYYRNRRLFYKDRKHKTGGKHKKPGKNKKDDDNDEDESDNDDDDNDDADDKDRKKKNDKLWIRPRPPRKRPRPPPKWPRPPPKWPRPPPKWPRPPPKWPRPPPKWPRPPRKRPRPPPKWPRPPPKWPRPPRKRPRPPPKWPRPPPKWPRPPPKWPRPPRRRPPPYPGGGGNRGSCQICGQMMGGSSFSEFVINGGVVRPVFKYPWMVSIAYRNENFCAGSIISATFVLTASSCLVNPQMLQSWECTAGVIPQSCFYNPNEIQVDLLGQSQGHPMRPVRPEQIIPHEKFEYEKGLYDIGLIKMASPLQCDQLSSPICLPTRDLNTMNQNLVIVGWGYDKEVGQPGSMLLREGQMRQIDPQACERMANVNDIVCAIGSESGQTVCSGDSGSPIFGPFGNKMFAVGVATPHASESCQTGVPVAYAKIFRYINWIKRYVTNLPNSQLNA